MIHKVRIYKRMNRFRIYQNLSYRVRIKSHTFDHSSVICHIFLVNGIYSCRYPRPILGFLGLFGSKFNFGLARSLILSQFGTTANLVLGTPIPKTFVHLSPTIFYLMPSLATIPTCSDSRNWRSCF